MGVKWVDSNFTRQLVAVVFELAVVEVERSENMEGRLNVARHVRRIPIWFWPQKYPDGFQKPCQEVFGPQKHT